MDSRSSAPISREGYMPSVFTTTSRGRPSRPTVINPYGIYRPALTINDRGLGNGANPAGAVNVGGNVEFDYHFILPEKQQSKGSKTYNYDDGLNKKSARLNNVT